MDAISRTIKKAGVYWQLLAPFSSLFDVKRFNPEKKPLSAGGAVMKLHKLLLTRVQLGFQEGKEGEDSLRSKAKVTKHIKE